MAKYATDPIPCDGPCGGLFHDDTMHRFSVYRDKREVVIGRYCFACCPRCLSPAVEHEVKPDEGVWTADDADQNPMLRAAVWRMFGMMKP